MKIKENFIDSLLINFFTEERFLIQEPGCSWKEICGRPSPDQIESHLAGEHYLGFIMRKTLTKFMVFDVDVKSPDQRVTLKSRFDCIIEIFGNPNMISSSPSGGLHIYYMLDDTYHHSAIHHAVTQLLQLERGNIELFPSNNGLRLLGGKDMHLLDDNLEIIADCPADIYQHLSYQLKFGRRHNLLSCLPYFPADKKPVKKHKPKLEKRFRFNELVGKGLSSPSSRHEAMLFLSHYLQTFEDFDRSTTITFLENWIRDKNNGFSKDFRRDPEMVKRDIIGVVNSYDRSKAVFPRSFNRAILSNHNIEQIQLLVKAINSRMGIKDTSLYPFLLDLFSYCKSNHQNFAVDIPKIVFQNCEFGSRTRYLKFKHVLKDMGILRTIRNYSTFKNECYRYIIAGEYIS